MEDLWQETSSPFSLKKAEIWGHSWEAGRVPGEHPGSSQLPTAGVRASGAESPTPSLGAICNSASQLYFHASPLPAFQRSSEP